MKAWYNAGMRIRDAREQDFGTILALNAGSVRFLGPLDPDRLAMLHGAAAYHRVAGAGPDIDAFLLAFREGSPYYSPNYRWFADRYERFLYVDRVVVAPDLRERGVGRALYEDLLAYARSSQVDLVTCEIDADNETSRRFHERFGFTEVGTQVAAGKLVSLRTLTLSDGGSPTEGG